MYVCKCLYYGTLNFTVPSSTKCLVSYWYSIYGRPGSWHQYQKGWSCTGVSFPPFRCHHKRYRDGESERECVCVVRQKGNEGRFCPAPCQTVPKPGKSREDVLKHCPVSASLRVNEDSFSLSHSLSHTHKLPPSLLPSSAWLQVPIQHVNRKLSLSLPGCAPMKTLADSRDTKHKSCADRQLPVEVGCTDRQTHRQAGKQPGRIGHGFTD